MVESQNILFRGIPSLSPEKWAKYWQRNTSGPPFRSVPCDQPTLKRFSTRFCRRLIKWNGQSIANMSVLYGCRIDEQKIRERKAWKPTHDNVCLTKPSWTLSGNSGKLRVIRTGKWYSSLFSLWASRAMTGLKHHCLNKSHWLRRYGWSKYFGNKVNPMNQMARNAS